MTELLRDDGFRLGLTFLVGAFCGFMLALGMVIARHIRIVDKREDSGREDAQQ